MKQITILKPSDFHVHLRQGKELKNYVQASEKFYDYIVVMPNTLPAIKTAEDAIAYREEILKNSSGKLRPLMSFKIFEDHNEEDLIKLKEAGAIIGKLYPKGATTNAEDGVESIEELFPVFEKMQELDMVLSIHGEEPSAEVFERERTFLATLYKIIKAFPKLRIVLEHLSTADSVDFIKSAPENVVGTITALHMSYTVDDLLGGGLNPHVFCKPIVQFEKDKLALIEAATSGNPKFFFGSDSAPHLKENKESASGAAGVFSALASLQLITEIFEKENALDKLENFVSVYGTQFYKLPQCQDKVTLTKEDNILAGDYFGVVPLAAGRTLKWKI